MTPEIPAIIKNHWAGGLSGGAMVHFAHIAWPWLKANNGLRGAWRVIIGIKPATITYGTLQTTIPPITNPPDQPQPKA